MVPQDDHSEDYRDDPGDDPRAAQREDSEVPGGDGNPPVDPPDSNAVRPPLAQGSYPPIPPPPYGMPPPPPPYGMPPPPYGPGAYFPGAPPYWYPPPGYGPPGYGPPGYGPPGYGAPGYGPPGYWFAPSQLPPPRQFTPPDYSDSLEGAQPPRSKGDAGFWFAMALAGFLVGNVAGLILIDAMVALFGHGRSVAQIADMSSPPEWYIVSSLLGLWVGFFGGPWIASRVRGTKRLIADFGVRFQWIDLVGIFIGIGGQFMVGILYAPFARYIHNFNAPAQKLTGGSQGWGFLLIAVLTVFGAPFFEELFFRGLLFKSLTKLFSPGPDSTAAKRKWALAAAVVVDGLLFGLAHGELVQLAALAGFGMVLAYVSYRTGRLGMNMIAHASFNLTAVVGILATRGGVIH